MATYSIFLCLENPHGQRSLAGYSPWGHEESDTTKQLNTAHLLALVLGKDIIEWGKHGLWSQI